MPDLSCHIDKSNNAVVVHLYLEVVELYLLPITAKNMDLNSIEYVLDMLRRYVREGAHASSTLREEGTTSLKKLSPGTFFTNGRIVGRRKEDQKKALP